MWPETYSQFDEQQPILKVFERTIDAGKPDGFRFLDVGAWDPICFSNTRALFERGWSGVMIEPSPTPMLSLLKAYGEEKRITLIQAAMVADTSQQIVEFTMSDDSVSTSNAEALKKWKNAAKFIGRCWVRTITWENINLWYGGFDFVNIDVEGGSVDVFHAMLGSGAKPACCCVEHDGRLVELSEAATRNGYKLVYSNGTNAVFAL